MAKRGLARRRALGLAPVVKRCPRCGVCELVAGQCDQCGDILNNEGQFWCLHCERVSVQGRDFGGPGDFCPYPGCDGSIWDMWPWSKLVKVNGYPAIAEAGVSYPLYNS